MFTFTSAGHFWRLLLWAYVPGIPIFGPPIFVSPVWLRIPSTPHLHPPPVNDKKLSPAVERLEIWLPIFFSSLFWWGNPPPKKGLKWAPSCGTWKSVGSGVDSSTHRLLAQPCHRRLQHPGALQALPRRESPQEPLQALQRGRALVALLSGWMQSLG